MKGAYVTLAGTENERHPVGQQPSGREQQRLSRGRVQPLSIIHHDDNRAFLRSLTQQTQRRRETANLSAAEPSCSPNAPRNARA